jgi:hypothetical protein
MAAMMALMADLRTEADLREALERGDLGEGERLDLKRELTPGDRGTKNTAIDLASFAIEGGTILVGVTPGRPPKLVAVPLEGLRERVEQIARSRVDPPLAVTVREIPAADDPERGYLVITVPASPDAPHAVDLVFRGRHGTVNVQLSAAEVRRIHERQSASPRTSIREVLAEFASHDPFAEDRRRAGRLFVVAWPVSAQPQMLERAVGERWRSWTEENVRSRPALGSAGRRGNRMK